MSTLFDSLSRNPIDRLPSPNFLPNDFLELLKSPDFDTKLQTLNSAVGIARRDDEWFNRFAKKGELFKCLDRILVDERWELQHQCIKFLVEAMPTFGNATEYCMCYVMPNLIPKLGSSKITVRKICNQAIVLFLKNKPEALQSFLKMLNNFMTNCREPETKAEIIHELPSLFLPELSRCNWSNLVDTLTADNIILECEERVGVTLKKLNEYLGNEIYDSIITSLLPDKREIVKRMTENVVLETNNDQKGGVLANRSTMKIASGERRLRFGIVPSVISNMIQDDNDVNARIAGLERLKQIIEQISPEEVTRLVPHLHSYLLTLSNVLADLNFKVVVLTLDIIRLTIHSLRGHMEAHLHQVVNLISKYFGNQKSVIKQLIMMSFMDLFQHINPKSVGGALRVFMENKNSRTREEVVNIITAALMTISPSKFNLTSMINNLVPLLNDPKRRVRLAAFEQLSVIAYLLNGKTEAILKVARDVENEQNARGLTEAVMSRLRRQLLPGIRYDGLIEYSTPPVSDTSFAVDESEMSNPENADLMWILNNGGREADPFERTVSPISLAGNLAVIRKNRMQQQQQQQQTQASNADSLEKEILQKMTMTRMKSDDSMLRRSGSAASNPNSSTSSWERPTKKGSRVTPSYEPMVASTSETKVRREVNNNSIEKKQQNGLVNLKTRSETNLSEDRDENNPPPVSTNFDDKPAKASGQYSFTDFETPTTMGKKSISHHSLPISSAHPPLKHAQSQPQKKNTFLKAGQGKKGSSAKPPKSFSMDTNNVTVQGALRKIENDDWSEKVEGLNMLAALSYNHPKQIEENLKEVTLAVLNECKNLRSSVSRVAIVTIGIIAQNMSTRIDSEMEKICAVLLNKSGDVSNAFIREDATDSLGKLVKSASAVKALQGIIAAGAKSKNNTTRASCASFVYNIIEIQGSAAILNNPTALSHVIGVLSQFCKDQTPQVRQYGRQALAFLAKDPNFDRLLRKNATDSEAKQFKEILATIEKRGGVDALDASSISLSGTLSRSGSTRRVQKKLPESVQLDLDEIRTEMTASGWERRIGGIQRFEEMCSHSIKAVASDTRLIEAFIGRIGDLNAKVASCAMDTYLVTLPAMAKLYSTESNLKAVLNQLIFALTAILSSKSEEHRHLAQTCIQATIKAIEPTALMPALAAATKKSNVKQRPFIMNQFCELCKLAFKTKPKQVEVTALPLLWDSVKQVYSDADNKKATEKLARTMAKLIGEKSLLDFATNELDPQRKKQLESLIR
ncbi:unnamed protein product [Caenorhabditis bovis]|uniref:TOG domain-containing protein n=1 Tax=Caenorhabditis bovis TaxID=2654633 RepID=A0A8S1EB60_9PELO|nr:unnamed protein product [Caenorhabditis bovis]